MYQLLFSPQAQKDAKKIATIGLKLKVENLLTIIKLESLKYPPKYEHLTGNLKGKLSRRINKQHRLVYEIFENEKKVKYQAIISPNSQQEKLWQFEITNLRDAQLFLSD